MFSFLPFLWCLMFQRSMQWTCGVVSTVRLQVVEVLCVPLNRRTQVVLARFNRRLDFLRASGFEHRFAVSHASQPAERASVPALSTESDGGTLLLSETSRSSLSTGVRWMDPAWSGETELDRIIASTDELGVSIVDTASGSIFQRMVWERWNIERCAVHNLCTIRNGRAWDIGQ